VTTSTPLDLGTTAFYLGIYFAFLVTALCFNLFNWTFGFVLFAIRASRAVHSRLINKLAHATVSFFDVTPTARITSRLTMDLFLIDFVLPVFLFQNSYLMFQILAAIAGVFLGAWYIGIVLVPLIPVYYLILTLCKLNYIEAQRLEALSRSPPISHLQLTIQGYCKFAFL
jgi:ABC-type multidrug transport system fused ATPase/permease subunit